MGFAWVGPMGLFCCTMAVVSGARPDAQPASACADAPQPPTLLKLVETYCRTDDPRKRGELVKPIEEASGGNVKAVADVLGQVQLWSPIEDRHGTFSYKSGDGSPITVEYALPPSYDPHHRYGLVLSFRHPSDTRGDCPNPLAGAVVDCGSQLDTEDHVWVCPRRPVEGTFHQPLSATGDLRRLMRAVRRRIHVDTDRVYAFGKDLGGDETWLAAISHPDLFAGVIALSAYPQVPYPEQMYPFLLGNLRSVPVLSHWKPAAPPHPGAPLRTRAQRVQAYSGAIARLAKEASLPIKGYLQMARAASIDVRRWDDDCAAILGQQRAPAGQPVTHWFRYPAYGNAGWLRQVKFEGDVWEDDQLSIQVSPAVDRNEYITRVIQDKMAYLGGKVDGQTITIETRRCARIELLLPLKLVDFSQPITVLCNGRKRYDRVLSPSIRTMLDQAYSEWEFQRPVAARLSFGIKSDTKRK